MSQFRKILFVPVAVALIVTAVVLMPAREQRPAQSQPKEQAPYADAAALRAEVNAAAAAQKPAKPAAAPTRREAPSSEPVGESPAPAQAGGTYTVKAGDTPATIAKQHLGAASRWPEIARANPGLNATSLRIGQVLQLPGDVAPAASEAQPATQKPTAAPAAAGASGAPLARHRVAQGDTLYKLARTYYGDPSRWTLIRDANRDLVGDGVAGLRLDSELVIPAVSEGGR